MTATYMITRTNYYLEARHERELAGRPRQVAVSPLLASGQVSRKRRKRIGLVRQ
jgi:hypothetical protein